jgi:hypothetical protein
LPLFVLAVILTAANDLPRRSFPRHRLNLSATGFAPSFFTFLGVAAGFSSGNHHPNRIGL